MRFILIALAIWGSHVWADCNDLPGGQVHYCIFDNPGSSNTDVIYYLHGRMGKAEQWGDADSDSYTQMIRDEWTRTGKQAPKVVSLSFGPVWLLAEKNPSKPSGLFEVMRDQVIPAMEQIIGGTKGKRIIMGESMGGFNSLQLALKTSLFQRATILCAPIVNGADPFDEDMKIDEMIKKSAAYAYYGPQKSDEIYDKVGEMIFMAKAVWKTRADWQKSDPLILASGVDKAVAPAEFYVNAGFYDPYALYEGNIELVKQLLLKGIKTEWHPEWGGHCKFDIPSLARFLVP